MRKSQTTNSGILGEMARISRALTENAADYPHLEGPRLRLLTVLEDAQRVAQHQASLTADKQEASRQLRELLVEGQRLVTGIIRFLQERYGTRSEKMAAFGLQPFRGRKPRSPKQPEPPPPTDPEAEVSAANDNPNL